MTVTPNRLVDSRIGVGLSSGLSANVAKTFTVTDQALGDPTKNIPSDAVAVTGNVTVTRQTAAGYIAVTPVATNTPSTATLNFPLADNRGNGLTVALGAGGTLSDHLRRPCRLDDRCRLRRDRLLRAASGLSRGAATIAPWHRHDRTSG